MNACTFYIIVHHPFQRSPSSGPKFRSEVQVRGQLPRRAETCTEPCPHRLETGNVCLCYPTQNTSYAHQGNHNHSRGGRSTWVQEEGICSSGPSFNGAQTAFAARQATGTTEDPQAYGSTLSPKATKSTWMATAVASNFLSRTAVNWSCTRIV